MSHFVHLNEKTSGGTPFGAFIIAAQKTVLAGCDMNDAGVLDTSFSAEHLSEKTTGGTPFAVFHFAARGRGFGAARNMVRNDNVGNVEGEQKPHPVATILRR